MLEWIKLETFLLNDERVQALLDDYGLAGLGTYVLLRSQIDAQSGRGLPLDYVLKIGGPLARKNKYIRILRNYGLFTEDDFGLVRACALTPAPESSASEAPAPVLSADVPTEEEKNRNLETDKSVIKKRFQKPSVDEIRAYCQQRLNQVDAARFWDFYESKGWLVGKTKMSDWKAAVRTWERSSKAESLELSDESGSINHKPSTINHQNGVQYYNGRPLPADAPPRPSDTAEWDEASGTWFELYR